MDLEGCCEDAVADGCVLLVCSFQDSAGVALECVVAEGIDGVADDWIELLSGVDAFVEGCEGFDFLFDVAGW